MANYAGQKMHPPPQVLTGVTLGARISSGDEADVRDWLRQLAHPVQLRKAILAKDRYAVELELVEL